MQQHMSYRKPVPTYTPSPESSPTESAFLEFPSPSLYKPSILEEPRFPPKVPQVAPPVYLGFVEPVSQHLIYRPPTPPRRRASLSVFDSLRRPDDAFYGLEGHLRSPSPVSFSLTDWYLIPYPSSTTTNQHWWQRFWMLRGTLKAKLRGFYIR
uniref:Uncharacterized protein n=1 Tax=Mycena chlorophos TaxID=658473 RepID=A0ABQ0M9M6_MYCCL|nr:predicted protein [Mycena chlorophos]